MSDLAALFPDLPQEVLREFDAANIARAANAPLNVQGEYSAVTDDQVADYLRSVGSLRAPLNPAVSGQTPPPAPQFLPGQGRPAPDPNAAYTEAPDYGDQPPPSEPAQPAQPAQQPARATETTPLPPSPVPPSQILQEPPASEPPTFIPPPPDLSRVGPEPAVSPPDPGRVPTSEQTVPDDNAAYIANLLRSDPNLRTLISHYLTTGQTPASTPPSAAAPPPLYSQSPVGVPPQPFSPATPPTIPPFDEYTDPHIRALYEQNARLLSRVDELAQSQKYANDQIQQSQVQHYETLVESVVSKFGNDYALPSNVLQSVRETAARLGAANSYMNGVHPVTGMPVRPDAAEAVRTALNIAYYATPAAQSLERERTIQRAQQDAQHRAKLAGVGGSSASVSRTPPQPTTPADRKTAMIAEVGDMLNGSWTGGNN